MPRQGGSLTDLPLTLIQAFPVEGTNFAAGNATASHTTAPLASASGEQSTVSLPPFCQ